MDKSSSKKHIQVQLTTREGKKEREREREREKTEIVPSSESFLCHDM